MGQVGLNEEQVALLEVVRSYAAAEVAPRVGDAEAEKRFPRELFDGLGKMDLSGLPFPEEDGGGGQPFAVYLRVVEELARASLTVGMGLSVHVLASWAVATYAGPELRRAVLPKLLSGEWLGAYSLSEPGSGSDAAALRTRAVRDGDDYVIDGVKAWVSHAGQADCYVVMCRTGEHRTRGISALLVPPDTPGLEFPPPERKMGLTSSPTGQLVFTGARVPATNLLGEEGDGFAIALSALEGGRLGIAACSVGVAQAALDDAVAYAQVREQFGRRIGDFQGLGFMLADMAAGVEAARALTQTAAARRDAGVPYGSQAAMAKMVASDTAMRVTTDAVQVLGGAGYTTEHRAERLFREAKVLQIVEGTNQIQRMVVARDLLG